MPLKITFENDEIADFLRVDPLTDARVIATMTASAEDEAEGFLNHDFSLIVTDTATGETVITPTEAPAAVKDWVLNRIAEKYENRGKVPKPDFSTLKMYRRLPFHGRTLRDV